MSDGDLRIVWEPWPDGDAIWPEKRIQKRVNAYKGDVVEFCVQLEYGEITRLEGPTDADYETVARFDHNEIDDYGHNMREEGLHMDFYRPSRKAKVLTSFPDVSVNEAPRWCQRFLEERASELIEQYKSSGALRGELAWR